MTRVNSFTFDEQMVFNNLWQLFFSRGTLLPKLIFINNVILLELTKMHIIAQIVFLNLKYVRAKRKNYTFTKQDSVSKENEFWKSLKEYIFKI